MTMWQRSKLYALGLLAAVFAAGIAVGTGVSAAASSGDTPRDRESRERRRPSYAERLQDELSLSSDQRDSVALIVDVYQDSMASLWAEMRPRMDSVRVHIRQDIMALLDSGQQERYRAYMHRTDSARAARDTSTPGERGRREQRP